MNSSRLTSLALVFTASCLVGTFQADRHVESAEQSAATPQQIPEPNATPGLLPFSEKLLEFQIANERLPGATHYFTMPVATPLGNLEKLALATQTEMVEFWTDAPANQQDFVTLSIRGSRDWHQNPVSNWVLIDSKGQEHPFTVLLHPTEGGISDLEFVTTHTWLANRLVFPVPRDESEFTLSVDRNEVCRFRIRD
jgi:hypothetical protein